MQVREVKEMNKLHNSVLWRRIGNPYVLLSGYLFYYTLCLLYYLSLKNYIFFG